MAHHCHSFMLKFLKQSAVGRVTLAVLEAGRFTSEDGGSLLLGEDLPAGLVPSHPVLIWPEFPGVSSPPL